VTTLSIIIPALNEQALIGETLASVIEAISTLDRETTGTVIVETLVVDNASTDSTARVVQSVPNVRIVHCDRRGAARARNVGARESLGDILCFLDADTLLPETALVEVLGVCRKGTVLAGIAPYCARDGGVRSRLWWWFWNHVRLLPIPRAKAMPAFMFCTREAFLEFGPFDERVAIGEEWPILAGVYARAPRSLAYLWSLQVPTSSRRMDLVRFGYTRLFCKYIWAILAFRGRVQYDDSIRHPTTAPNQTG
jgi:glycosyltransferase involved in cell wall biosynthesis